MTIEHLERTTVGDLVAADARAADVLERFGIDFCCGGRRPFADACRAAGADPVAVRRALEALPPPDGETERPAEWPVDRLLDYIVSTHHAYLREATPAIGRRLARLVEVHGERHPELAHIRAVFMRLGRELHQHMLKEEHVLFPYIREMASLAPGRRVDSPFGTVANPIRMMEREHEQAGADLRLLRELTQDYTPPADGCATYQLCFAELDRFERDLHIHVHLEDHVLFPRAIELERSLRL